MAWDFGGKADEGGRKGGREEGRGGGGGCRGRSAVVGEDGGREGAGCRTFMIQSQVLCRSLPSDWQALGSRVALACLVAAFLHASESLVAEAPSPSPLASPQSWTVFESRLAFRPPPGLLHSASWQMESAEATIIEADADVDSRRGQAGRTFVARSRPSARSALAGRVGVRACERATARLGRPANSRC